MEAAATVPIMPINELSTNLLPKRAAVGATGISTMMIAWLSMVSIGVMNVIIIGGGGGVARKMTRDDEIAQQKEARNMTKKGEGGGGGERSIKVHTTKTHMIPTPRTPRAKAIALLLLLRRRPFRRYRTTFIGTKTKGRERISQKEATRRGR